MRAAGVVDYAAFVKELTSQITDKPISGIESKDVKAGTDLCWGKK